MPTYEYQCQSCSEKCEAFQSMSAAPLTTCEKCGGELKKLISKGGGFFVKGGSSGTPGRQAGCSKPTCGGCHSCR
jgi:putative FmdB family regulatory protein